MNFKEILQKGYATAIFEILEQEIQNEKELLDLFWASEETFYTGFVGVISYKATHVFRKHPEWIKSIYEKLSAKNSYRSYTSIQSFYYALLFCAKNKFVNYRLITPFIHTGLTKLDVFFQYIDYVYQKIFGIVKDHISYADRKSIYKFLKEKLSKKLSSEVLAAMVDDYSHATFEDKDLLADIIAFLDVEIKNTYPNTESYVNLMANVTGKILNQITKASQLSLYWDKITAIVSTFTKEDFLFYSEKLREKIDPSIVNKVGNLGRLFLYIIGYVEQIPESTEPADVQFFVNFLDCLPSEKFWALVDNSNLTSVHAAFFLNSNVITERKNVATKILKTYLKSPIEARKLNRPLLLLDDVIIEQLSDKEVAELIKRSIKKKKAIRFDYTESAVKLIKNKLTALAMTDKKIRKIFPNFMSLYCKEATVSDGVQEQLL